jgi:hypothetical protein
MSSKVEQSHVGSDTFGADEENKALHCLTSTLNLPSGSHILFPSSSKDANLAWREDAATIKQVVGSKTTLEHDRPRGTDRKGKGPSTWKSGIHSSKLGPLKPKSVPEEIGHRGT